MVKYKVLNQTNPEFDEEQIEKLKLLYWGGHEILKEAYHFIPKESMESPQSYQNRLNCASYKNYLSEIVNAYTSEVFAKTLTVIPTADAEDPSTEGTTLSDADFYQQFAENCDLKGTSLTNTLNHVLTDSVVVGRAYLTIDFPKPTVIPKNLLEEEKLGTSRAYLVHIDADHVIDWEVNEITGYYKFLVIKNEYCERNSFNDSRDLKTIRFKVWEKNDNGVVTWKVFELKIKANKQPKPDDECALVEEGVVSFPEIPVVCLKMPYSLWIGNLIGGLCADHFKRYSSLIHAENRNLFSIPVYQQGPELSSSGDLSEMAQNPNRGMQAAAQMRIKGFAVTGPEDKIYFAEPDGKAYELVNDQLRELTEEIHKITSLMAASITGAGSNRSMSGLSKILDNRAKEIILTAYGELIKSYIVKIYSLISKARNEDISWTALGLDDYKITVDREQLLKEATSISLINIPSKTFKKAQLTQMAVQLLDTLSPQEQLTIKQEIEESIESGYDDLYSIEAALEQKEDEKAQVEDSNKFDKKTSKKDK